MSTSSTSTTAATAASPAAGSNSIPTLDAIKQACYEFGLREGDGALARADFTDMITSRAKDGDCTIDQSEELWADFQKGARLRISREVGGAAPDTAEMAQRASDLKHYITLGANVHLDGPELLANARMVLKGMRDDGTAKGLRTWDVMLVWLRKQNASPERALTDGEIEDLFRERAKRATDELDRLTSARNVLLKQKALYDAGENDDADDASDGDGDGDGDDNSADPETTGSRGLRITRAIELIEGCIADLGGTRKDQRKEARAQERARKEAAKEAAKAAREKL